VALPISVVIPVGPNPEYIQWLDECIRSILDNEADEIIVIEDMAFLDLRWKNNHSYIQFYENDWLLGCADSWNRGVALAQNNLVFLMGSDDYLLPGCLEAVVNGYEINEGKDAWYNVTCQYENGDLQDSPNNAAAVTRGLWKLTGGFEPAAFAAPDAHLLSIMMIHFPDRIIQVEKGTPYYFVRQHPYQDTPRQFGRFFTPVHQIRDIGTRTWTKPEWTTEIG